MEKNRSPHRRSRARSRQRNSTSPAASSLRRGGGGAPAQGGGAGGHSGVGVGLRRGGLLRQRNSSSPAASSSRRGGGGAPAWGRRSRGHGGTGTGLRRGGLQVRRLRARGGGSNGHEFFTRHGAHRLHGAVFPSDTNGSLSAMVMVRSERTMVRWERTTAGALRPQELLSQDGLFSSNKQVQSAALCSLSTLMTITPKDTYLEFEKHFIGLQERTLHDSFSENDIKIFCTPEGQLSTEQGVYVAEAVASKNTELAKGHFHAYGDQDVDTAFSVVPAKTEKRESSGTGKRETGKSTKKTVDKAKTAKGEARELLLKEEASVRMKVGQVKKNLSLMLDALGELAIANPMFIHGQLPSLVKYVEPLLSSAIVSDAAFRTMVSLAGTARPLCNLASEIAAAIRVIMEEDSKKKQSSGLFEKIVNGLKIACKAGPLPAESFTFVFPIMERILLSSKKTCLHDDVLHILSMHLDPILPLPRPRMLSVLYHVLSTVPAYCTSVGPMLNELCLGLRSHELAQALVGVYAKEVHVRIACLNAIKCVPIHSVQQDLLVSGSLWIATHDPKNEVAELANELWDHFGFDEITDYSGILDALYHKNYNVPGASAEALSAALDENPDKMQKSKKASWTLYDNLVFVKMCIEEKESCGEVSQNTYQANHFIEKFFFKTGKVFMPEQFKHKFLKLQNTHNRWEDLDHLNDRRKRNPTKTLKDFTKKRPLYENLPGLIDLLMKIFKDCPNKQTESDDVSDIVLEHSSTVNTHSNCLDENSIINTLEDTIKEDTIKSLKMKLEQSMKQKEKVEKCLKTEEGKRKRAEECLKTEEDKRKRAEKEVHNLQEQMMALRGHISTEVRSILDVYKS